ncbi:energy transducer TonB [Stenotrophomonas acidaminiphila]|nr:energy transducer TonB [Stenotrophomonas acidaminiphila]
MRARFSVEGENSTQHLGQRLNEAETPQVSKCDLIEKGEAKARQQCESGNFNACRDIAGWVANKVMEGCSSETSSSAQQVEEEGGRTASQNAQSQSSSSSVDASAQEQYMAEEATIDITSRNMSPPRYPPAAFRAGIQGEVGLVVDVDASGNVINVAVEKSSRNRDLDRAAMEAARKWRFNAAKSSSGVPMAGRVRVPVTFALDGGESSTGVPEESTSSIRFKSIRDAIAELWAHSDYANLREADFSRIDVARGIAEVDASTQMFLPPGSTDTLVTYYEGNSGLHELIAYRYDGNQWRDVSREVLPGYQADASRFRGTNYYLDGAGGTVKVRSLPAKKAWRYSGGRFVQES